MHPDLEAWRTAGPFIYLAPLIPLWLGYGLRKTLAFCFAAHVALFLAVGFPLQDSLWFATLFAPIMALSYGLARIGRGWSRLCDRIFGGSEPAKPMAGANRRIPRVI